MSNPATHVSNFDGSAPGWTVSGPERYDGGLWLEEAGVNYLVNPTFAVDTAGWISAVGVTSLTRVASAVAESGFAGRVVFDGATAYPFASSSAGSLPAAGAHPFVASALLSGVLSGNNALYINVWANGFGTRYVNGVYVPVDGTPTEYDVATASVGGDTIDEIDFIVGDIGSGSPSATEVVIANPQLEINPYPTSFIADSLGDGYSPGSGGTHVRAASSASIDPTGLLSPGQGALAFRITPTIETGLEEIWGECGVKGSGTDHVQWGRDATLHPFVEWSANDAAYQRLTATETLAATAEAMLYLGHDGTAISLQVDDGTLHTDTRDAVSDSWGAGDLVLEASVGGVVYDGFATFERELTGAERRLLRMQNTWTMYSLVPGRFAFFQLRPY